VSPDTGDVGNAAANVNVGVAELLEAVINAAQPRSAVVVVLFPKIITRPLNWSAAAPAGEQAEVVTDVVVELVDTVAVPMAAETPATFVTFALTVPTVLSAVVTIV